MFYYLLCVHFVFGLVMGSFYYVVGTRLSEDKSIVYPNSCCPNCHHELKAWDLFPVFSYLFAKGKCRYCKKSISIIYPLIEIATGIVFAISFAFFPSDYFSLIMALILASLLIIICISDFKYMIIPDQVIITAIIAIIITKLISVGVVETMWYILWGILAFALMLGIKLLGDFIFKKESMGGADIKYMFIAGLSLGMPNAIFVIFLASCLALPVAVIVLYKNKEHIIPYGPFLAVATWGLWLLQTPLKKYLDQLFNI